MPTEGTLRLTDRVKGRAAPLVFGVSGSVLDRPKLPPWREENQRRLGPLDETAIPRAFAKAKYVGGQFAAGT